MMGRILAFIVLCVFAAVLGTCARAEPLVIGVHAVSYHAPDRSQNNVNPGLYIRSDRWQVGMYHNSYRDTTTYVSHAWPLGNDFELVGGIAHGYQHSGTSRGALTPMGGITYTSPVKVFGVTPKFFAIPPTPKNSAVVHLALEF